MSKYKLTKLLSEVQGGRIGTLNISARGLEMTMEELENEGAVVNRFYNSPDGKTYVEYHVHPDGDYNPDTSFSVYDFKLGEDPTDVDNDDKEYPFSIGGKGSALNSAKALLGLDNEKSIDENEAVDLAIEASQEKAGIDEEAPIEEGVMKSIISALGEYGNESEIEMYMDSLRKSGDSFDDVEDYVEDFKNYIADKSLQEHFGRFMKDYQ
jgi:hypothetical protein